MNTSPFGIVLHGGAGNLARYSGTSRLHDAAVVLSDIVDAAYALLSDGAAALDVATDVVAALEECGLFHAGRGSSPDTSGMITMDASVMEGLHRRAGAVAGISQSRYPVRAARAVMEHSQHVMLIGGEADRFACFHGIATVDRAWFMPCDVIDGVVVGSERSTAGTVGAAVLDRTGNLAAATSTGGTLRKTAGRVGDSPVIGAGTYAANGIAAVSCTGTGEMFLREVAAYQVIARMELAGENVVAATSHVMQRIAAIGGDGGMVAIDRHADVAMPFNTNGMYRAARTSLGMSTVGILADP